MSEGALSSLSGHHSCQVTVDSNKSSPCQLHPQPTHTQTQLLPRKQVAAKNTLFKTHILLWFYFQHSFAVRLVILAATIAAISTQNTSMWCLRGQKGHLFSGEYSMQTKKGNYSLSWKIHKNLYLCESTMHHWRYKNEFDRSYRFLACLSKRGCVQWAVPSSSANYIFPTWLKMCWNVHYHVCLHENITSARSERSKHEGMSLCLLVGLSRTVPSCVCVKQRHSSPCCVIPD